MSSDAERGTHFIEARVEADLASGTYGGRVATRFPPEPNGYLHIGHTKAIFLSFGIAQKYGGTCNLRFDDTNPETEDTEYVEAILRDVRWLGFEPSRVLYASDYFEQLYQWAEKLVRDGKAYVDDQSLEEMRANRGTVTEPGRPSPGRSRSPDDNLALLRQMRAGAFDDGAMVLRAKIDLAHPNMKMRDPLMYRIRRTHHFRTGDAWCIYPMYDWAHGQSDAIEGITHSLCSLEFENNRELYDWFLAAIGDEALGVDHPPQQIEFARLNLSWTVMSKRHLKRLVTEGHVRGWDDPRMPTVAGLRRRGVTPTMLRTFSETIGMAKAQSTVDIELLDHVVRDELNRAAPRRMAVLDPLPVEITNWPEDRVEALDAADFPPDVGLPGSRRLPFGRRLLIERGDFAVDPPAGWRRLVPGGEVRLRHAWVIRCDRVITDDEGRVVRLEASIDPDTRGRNPDRKVAGTIHWVHADTAVSFEARLYDRLFRVAEPGADGGEFIDDLNPDSLVVVAAHGEPALAAVGAASHVQLERQGYFFRDPLEAGLVLNRTVTLKDSWARAAVAAEPVVAVAEGPSGEEAAELNEAARRQQVEAFLAAHPALRGRYDALVDAGAQEVEVRTVLEREELRALLDAAGGSPAAQVSVVAWLVHVVAAELKGREAHALSGAALAELVGLVEQGTITRQVGRELTAELVARGGSAAALVAERGLAAVADADALGATVDDVLAALPDEVARYRAGDQRLFGFFVGKVMKATGGRARPDVVQRVLRERLG